MPTHQRGNSSSGRRPQAEAGSPGSSLRSSDQSGVPASSRASDDVETLRDALNLAHTELNKARQENDRHAVFYEQINKLKQQLESVSKENASNRNKYLQGKADYDALKNEHHVWVQRCQKAEEEKLMADKETESLTKDYNTLLNNFRALSDTSNQSPTQSKASSLPERTKDKGKRDGNNDRGRGRDRDREKQEKRELKAEKERLSRRFEGRPPTSRRDSFIEGWGPAGRSTSATPLSRQYLSAASGRRQGPPPPINSQNGFGNPSVPRTPNTHPMSPNGPYSSGSSAAFDDDAYDDGNYHAFPLKR